MRKCLDPTQEAALIQAYVAGATLETLAQTHGCTAGTVCNTLRRHGVARRPPGVPVTPPSAVKECSVCHSNLPREAFYGAGRRTSVCKDCQSKKEEDAYYGATDRRVRCLKSAKEWAAAHPERRRSRDWKRLRLQGWTREQFELAWKQQRGRCAICNVSMQDRGTTPISVHADHDHVTGQPRALLCAHCNRGLGSFRDSPEALRRAADFVERFSPVSLEKTGT